ncbi:MAG TPA: hypothetical protein DCR62_06105 [Acholeplasmatales bacterium]|nr:hypothetical protein [Acholeplasmatales bacterium]
MKIMDLNQNGNLQDWGIERTSKQKTIPWKEETEEYDVYKIPLDILAYNLRNGRMFMEVKKFESEEKISLAQLKEDDIENYNNEVENLIWSTNEEKNEHTKNDIAKYGQIEPGVVLDDGTVIDGNRRFTCLRRLHREFPNEEKYKYFLAAIIKVDGQKITKKLLKEYELRVQFGSDEKVGYNTINMNMSIYELIEKNESKDFDYTTVAELVNKSVADINKICKTCRLVEEFLIYIGKEGEYQIAETKNIYWPLEPLVTYFNNDGRNLTLLEKEERKNLFFDYLLTLDVPLPTQNLRDGLIKKIFKNQSETNDLINKHKNIIGDKIQDVIETSTTTEEFLENINALKQSESANEDKKIYEDKLNKISTKSQLDLPIKECQRALETLQGVNVKPLVQASSTIADKKIKEINDKLTEIIRAVESIKLEIEHHE